MQRRMMVVSNTHRPHTARRRWRLSLPPSAPRGASGGGCGLPGWPDDGVEGGGGTRPIGSSWARARSVARSRQHPGPWRDPGTAEAGYRSHRRPHNDGRSQHGGRGFLGYRRLRPLRPRRRRDAGPRPSRQTRADGRCSTGAVAAQCQRSGCPTGGACGSGPSAQA